MFAIETHAYGAGTRSTGACANKPMRIIDPVILERDKLGRIRRGLTIPVRLKRLVAVPQ